MSEVPGEHTIGWFARNEIAEKLQNTLKEIGTVTIIRPDLSSNHGCFLVEVKK
jgi:hypothetical protein